MSEMFSKCYNLINLDLSSFDTKNVTNINNMFYNCYYLTNINLSKKNGLLKKEILFGNSNSKINIINRVFYIPLLLFNGK